MDNQEFETALKEFEKNIQKRLPNFINVILTNKGNREQEAAYAHFLDTLKRQRAALAKEIPRVAKAAQKIRYYNVISNMDAQLRSMGNRESFQTRLQMRRHQLEAPIQYDAGHGMHNGEILNVFESGVLLKTSEKVAIDHEVRVTVGGQSARGKAMWSIPIENGSVETGIKLIEIPDELAHELDALVDKKKK